MWRHRGTFRTPYLFRFPNLVHLMFLPWIETVSLMFVLIVMCRTINPCLVSMGPSSSSYTLQVSFHNVEAQRYISDSLPLPVPKFGPFDVPPDDRFTHVCPHSHV
ncbi:unnamed protein product [Microthlaspi erraticum]|uniref:Uncharacterized protein n=1 Tax=Microthlaspi erraticum TaxID=1685480 RepID=A0A6D2HXK1_9BRAS|nr:unnamed protein product [Microthlaspi erraticum]